MSEVKNWSNVTIYEKFMATYLIPLCEEDCDLTKGLCKLDSSYLEQSAKALEEFVKDSSK